MGEFGKSLRQMKEQVFRSISGYLWIISTCVLETVAVWKIICLSGITGHQHVILDSKICQYRRVGDGLFWLIFIPFGEESKDMNQHCCHICRYLDVNLLIKWPHWSSFIRRLTIVKTHLDNIGRDNQNAWSLKFHDNDEKSWCWWCLEVQTR